MSFYPISKIEFEAATEGVVPCFHFQHGTFIIEFTVVSSNICLIKHFVAGEAENQIEYYLSYGIEKHQAIAWIQTRQDEYYRLQMEAINAGTKDDGEEVTYDAEFKSPEP